MLKKILPWVVFVTLFGLIIIGFALKDNMNAYLSKMMKAQAGSEITNSWSAYVDSTYNYSRNRQRYQFTFLEFGANCPACKRIESVMEEIRTKYTQEVNVVFLNVLKPENQILMKYFGIASIPTQILLDNNGIEFFSHSGYYSAEELTKYFTFSFVK